MSSTKVEEIGHLDREIAEFDLLQAPHSATLSVQELYLLEKAGYEVCQVVVGNIVYAMGLKGLLKSVQRAFIRGEMVDFTHMNKDARNIARNRMLEAASKVGATDVVNVVFQSQEYADFIEITVIGTAIKKVRNADSDIETAIGM